jgi:hypothetical protein
MEQGVPATLDMPLLAKFRDKQKLVLQAARKFDSVAMARPSLVFCTQTGFLSLCLLRSSFAAYLKPRIVGRSFLMMRLTVCWCLRLSFASVFCSIVAVWVLSVMLF